MDLQQRITQIAVDSIETVQHATELMMPSIANTAEALVASLVNDGKILCCGNDGSAALSQYFCSALVNRFDRERPGLPALSLNNGSALITAIASTDHYRQIYAQQIRTLANPQDILVVISPDGQDENLLTATQTAQDRGLRVVALNGQNGGMLSEILSEQDIEIRIPSSSIARIQETHLLVINCLCELIDNLLFGADE